MRAQHRACKINNLTRLGSPRPQLFDHRGIVAVRDKADVLTVGLVGDGQAIARGQRAGLGFGGQMAERKPQVIQLILPGRKQEIALIARGVLGAVQFGPGVAKFALNIMTGRHAVGVQVAGGGQQVLELDPLVAANAGNRGGSGKVGIREFINHRGAKPVLIIQHIVRKPHGFGDAPRIVNIAPGTARALFGQGSAMIVKLQGDTHHVVALFGKHRRHHRTVDPARHRHHHARLRREFGNSERIERLIQHLGVPRVRLRRFCGNPCAI